MEAESPSTPSWVCRNWTKISRVSLMSSPKYFMMMAETFLTASLAISPSFPVAIISDFFPPMVTADSIAKIIPDWADPPPMTANPLTRPTCLPVVTMTSYSFFRSMYLSAICCSRGRARTFASLTCWAVAN